jgi:hypothetical protein
LACAAKAYPGSTGILPVTPPVTWPSRPEETTIHHASMALPQSQRDCAPQPRVGLHRGPTLGPPPPTNPKSQRDCVPHPRVGLHHGPTLGPQHQQIPNPNGIASPTPGLACTTGLPRVPNTNKSPIPAGLRPQRHPPPTSQTTIRHRVPSQPPAPRPPATASELPCPVSQRDTVYQPRAPLWVPDRPHHRVLKERCIPAQSIALGKKAPKPATTPRLQLHIPLDIVKTNRSPSESNYQNETFVLVSIICDHAIHRVACLRCHTPGL